MYLVDSSAWIEYLRDTDSSTCNEVERLYLAEPDRLAITEPVIMEVLAGSTGPATLCRLEELVASLPLLAVDSWTDYRSAAASARACRAAGHPVRSIVDCLIAAVAVRTGAALLHRDRDFDHLATCLPDLHIHHP